MAKKKKTGLYIGIVLLAAVLFTVYQFLGPVTHKTEKGFLYIRTGTTMNALRKQLVSEKFLSGLTWFDLASRAIGFKEIKPGKYRVPRGTSIINLVRRLKNGTQIPVDFVVTKIRTKEMLAGRMGRAFEYDSLRAIQFLSNNDSLRSYGLDSNTVMAAVLPLNYAIKWNTAPEDLFDKFYEAYKRFWNEDRLKKAADKRLTPLQVITIASIIDEETNITADKSKIASVYMNRLEKGMPLQADPTIKFALKDFGLKRILLQHLNIISPYNTYRNKGLPPGPICTPQLATVDAVLDAPQTDYIYFVANSNFDGTSVFSSDYATHKKYAKMYQDALDAQIKIRDSLNALK
ncbi:aminodeoxychorismate lyase [Niabella ginsenosidivorans]|uniref:Endolytic murein transglycosylase n=1 Tax=Niabella ginsenosidivorans TaxID=1176587 RepID=A0A1A9I0H1_9BACT|nr:endolytic transglycosylase MltG [Niabella ginsenosidivorans]ANH81003.1 aminodeoxychorismate lyase [Niabella ginsenosidivorans]